MYVHSTLSTKLEGCLCIQSMCPQKDQAQADLPSDLDALAHAQPGSQYA
jgi:hypothetical protein